MERIETLERFDDDGDNFVQRVKFSMSTQDGVVRQNTQKIQYKEEEEICRNMINLVENNSNGVWCVAEWRNRARETERGQNMCNDCGACFWELLRKGTRQQNCDNSSRSTANL